MPKVKSAGVRERKLGAARLERIKAEINNFGVQRDWDNEDDAALATLMSKNPRVDDARILSYLRWSRKKKHPPPVIIYKFSEEEKRLIEEHTRKIMPKYCAMKAKLSDCDLPQKQAESVEVPTTAYDMLDKRGPIEKAIADWAKSNKHSN